MTVSTILFSCQQYSTKKVSIFVLLVVATSATSGFLRHPAPFFSYPTRPLRTNDLRRGVTRNTSRRPTVIFFAEENRTDVEDDDAVENECHSHSRRSEDRPWFWQWRTKVTHILGVPLRNTAGRSLARVLVDLNPALFPTRTQARKACRHGEIIVFRAEKSDEKEGFDEKEGSDRQAIELDGSFVDGVPVALRGRRILLSATSTIARASDVLAVQTRLRRSLETTAGEKRSCYPPCHTGFLYPPFFLSHSVPLVVFQDDLIAVVKKPEMLVTIGKKREDLQSFLPFLLYPPDSEDSELMTPAPVHRLDRRTSGLVLVAKTRSALRELGRSFAERRVKKSYAAWVLQNKNATPPPASDADDGAPWNVIDYPIDGKKSTTHWRPLRTLPLPSLPSSGSEEHFQLSLLDIRPVTGRYHQIRRHLSYCLGMPIVGDGKYDGGGSVAMSLRCADGRIYLCSYRLEFPYPAVTKGTVNITRTERPGDIDPAIDDGYDLGANKKFAVRTWRKGFSCSEDDGSSITMMSVCVPLPQKFGQISG